MFYSLKQILEEAFLFEAVDAAKIERAMDLSKRVIIRYHGEDGIPTRRQIEIFAYGLSKAGNPVIRAFQIANSPSAHPTKSGEWKMFRLDRITDIKMTPYDISAMYPYLKKKLRNRRGDKTMSQVFKVYRADYEIVDDDERQNVSTLRSAMPKGSTKPNNGVIGTYKMNNGDVLNIIGLIRTKNNKTIARTDTGGHLFINYNNLDTSTPVQQNQQTQNNSPQPGNQDDTSWEEKLKQGLDKELSAEPTTPSKDNIQNQDANSNNQEQHQDDESNNGDEYNKENDKR